MKESPFAPLEAWLRESLDDAQLVLAIESPDLDDPRPALEAYDVGDHHLDLRHGPTRYAVLRALHDVGVSRPWALGAPWSPLTDEQAGRATAAILRAVGSDPSKPTGVVPVCVLGPWFWPIPHLPGTSCGMSARDVVVGDADRIRVCEPPSMAAGWRAMGNGGPETGEPGRIAADSAARKLGCIMIEGITP